MKKNCGGGENLTKRRWLSLPTNIVLQNWNTRNILLLLYGALLQSKKFFFLPNEIFFMQEIVPFLRHFRCDPARDALHNHLLSTWLLDKVQLNNALSVHSHLFYITIYFTYLYLLYIPISFPLDMPVCFTYCVTQMFSFHSLNLSKNSNII